MSELVTVESIMRDKSIAGFSKGKIFGDLANLLGAPDYWHFAPGPELNFYVGFGHLEIYVRSGSTGTVVLLVKLKAFKFKRRFSREFNGKRIVFDIAKAWLEHSSAILVLDRMNIPYSTEFEEIVHPGTAAVINLEGNVRLYYTADGEGNTSLHSVEIS